MDDVLLFVIMAVIMITVGVSLAWIIGRAMGRSNRK